MVQRKTNAGKKEAGRGEKENKGNGKENGILSEYYIYQCISLTCYLMTFNFKCFFF